MNDVDQSRLMSNQSIDNFALRASERLCACDNGHKARRELARADIGKIGTIEITMRSLRIRGVFRAASGSPGQPLFPGSLGQPTPRRLSVTPNKTQIGRPHVHPSHANAVHGPYGALARD